jgi:hypothetical protein
MSYACLSILYNNRLHYNKACILLPLTMNWRSGHCPPILMISPTILICEILVRWDIYKFTWKQT